MRHGANCCLPLVVAVSLFFISHALLLRPIAGACEPRERDALLAFKEGITRDPAGRLASWRQGGNCCQWRGIHCSNRTGHVLKLQLGAVPVPCDVAALVFPRLCSDDTALVGQIAPSLLSLEHLEHLDLSWNSLEGPTGRLPEFLGSMKSLRYLDLSDIPFTGMLPPQLGNLSNLHYLDLSGKEYLDLSRNVLSMLSTDLSWLTNLPSLHHLDLTFVNLSTAVDWPHIVNMIPSLRVLHLPSCSLQSANQSLPRLNLTKLEWLDLRNNIFYHPSASCWFWNLTSLKHLDLSCNHLYGQFPDALGDMTSLQVFDFSFNVNASGFGTSILAPNLLRNLCNLEILDLENSLLSGNITELFESLPHCPSKKLRELSLSYNNIIGTLPMGMGQFTSLVTLDLSNNKLIGVLTEEHFADLNSLEDINLSDNHLKIVVGPEWSPPSRLDSILFASCQIGPQFPAWLQRLAGIDWIDISSNGITNQLPDWFSTAFSKVTYLDISNNRISGGLPPNIETMPLWHLNLGSNQLTGDIPPLPRNLTYLDISRNALSGRVPGSICKTQELEYLDLSDNLLEGEFPQCFGMKSANALLLSNNRFSGKFPSFLQRCSHLAYLDLSRNNFFGRLPMWIEDLKGLRYLQLSYNMFYGNISSDITNLMYLRDLNLASNRLSGVIPSHLSNLATMAGKHVRDVDGWPFTGTGYNLSVVMKRRELYYIVSKLDMLSIDLSSNCLTGEIPEDIASLALINLNLSFNFLSGKIPDKIGSMQSLESLDLSRNKLFGEIPLNMSNLTYLSYLDLSYNNLSGRIPSGSQLDSLYAEHPDMYSGNNGLCGPPLQRNCSGGIASKQGNDHKRTTAHVPEPNFFFYLGLGSGFVVGLWVVFCVILFKKTWRVAYFRYFDKVYDKIYAFVVVTWTGLAQKTST